MIKFNNSDINKWYNDDSELIKVYYHGAVCYYKADSSSPSGQTPCFAVVADITQYSDTEFEDVFNKADGKWYKLNNLNQYEEYGVYGSSTATTYYDGKLVIQDGYEYQYSSGSWNNVGEISGSSRIPINFTEVEYIENTSSAYINTNLILLENIGDSFEIKVKTYFTPYGNDFEYLFGTEQTSSPYTGIQLRYYKRNLQYSSDSNVVWTHIDNGDGTSGVTASCSSINATNGGNPLTLFCGLWSTGPWRYGRGKIYSFKVTKNNGLVRDLVPCKRNSDNMVGMYDVVNEEFYYPPNYQSYQLVAGSPTSGGTEYPLYYDEIQDPPNNLSFSSMTEAEQYECPYVGLEAIIAGDKYVFSGDSQSGYEWVEKQTDWYTLQDLINTHTIINKGNDRYELSPTVNGIAFFRVHTDKVSGSQSYVDLYNDNLPSPPYFGIRDDSDISLYKPVDGYSNLKNAANSTSCTWAYWIDANTIEVNAQAIMNDTMKIGFYSGSFPKLLLSFELPTI